MNHKQLLALFLCLVMIFSSSIVSIESSKIVNVKEVTNNIDKYIIENFQEEKDNYIINIFYPLTKSNDINEKITKKIEEYKQKFLESKYTANKKKLIISFEEFEYEDYTSFRFNVYNNVGITHQENEVFTIVYKDNDLIDIDYIASKNTDIISKLYNECSQRLKQNEQIKKYSNQEWLEKLSKDKNIYSNFLLTKNSIIVIFNPDTIAPNVAGIIQIEIPYEDLDLIM